MSKKLLSVGVVLALVAAVLVSVPAVNAQSTSLCQSVSVLFTAGVIPADKLAAANAAAGCSATATATATASFTRNLTVGSTGADVTALQVKLGVTPATGYFGSITKAAVIAYQTANGISGTGYVGPLTLASLNKGAVVVAPAAPALCPNGMTLASNCGTASSVTVTPANGTDGTLTASQSSYVSSGIQLKKGDTKDVVAVTLKASTGSVSVNRVAVHFNTRPWLIMSQVTLHDSNGKVLATKALNSAADATEITVGSDYLVQFDGVNFTVNPGTNMDLVVASTFHFAKMELFTLDEEAAKEPVIVKF